MIDCGHGIIGKNESTTMQSRGENEDDEKEEDLDDFFASLE